MSGSSATGVAGCGRSGTERNSLDGELSTGRLESAVLQEHPLAVLHLGVVGREHEIAVGPLEQVAQPMGHGGQLRQAVRQLVDLPGELGPGVGQLADEVMVGAEVEPSQAGAQVVGGGGHLLQGGRPIRTGGNAVADRGRDAGDGGVGQLGRIASGLGEGRHRVELAPGPRKQASRESKGVAEPLRRGRELIVGRGQPVGGAAVDELVGWESLDPAHLVPARLDLGVGAEHGPAQERSPRGDGDGPGEQQPSEPARAGSDAGPFGHRSVGFSRQRRRGLGQRARLASGAGRRRRSPPQRQSRPRR